MRFLKEDLLKQMGNLCFWLHSSLTAEEIRGSQLFAQGGDNRAVYSTRKNKLPVI